MVTAESISHSFVGRDKLVGGVIFLAECKF